MIEGKKYMIIEPQDIVDACDHLERVMIEANKQIEAGAPEVLGMKNAACGIVVDIFTAIAAAGVGAAIAKKQGGLIILKEDATADDKRAAAEALEKLRPINLGSQTEKGFTPGDIPQ